MVSCMALYLPPGVIFLLMLVASAAVILGFFAFATKRDWLPQWMFKSAAYGVLMPLIGILGGWSFARIMAIVAAAR